MEFFIILFVVIIIFVFVAIAGASTHKEKELHYEQHEIELAGQLGESTFNYRIKKILHDDDILINDVEICIEGRKCQIDFLILNSNGIFLIETKNYSGTIDGEITDRVWHKTKTTDAGNVYTKQINNPVNQMKRQVGMLAEVLRKNNIRIWINGYVYFINSNSPISADCIIDNLSDFEKIIHQSKSKKYSQIAITNAKSLLSRKKLEV